MAPANATNVPRYGYEPYSREECLKILKKDNISAKDACIILDLTNDYLHKELYLVIRKYLKRN